MSESHIAPLAAGAKKRVSYTPAAFLEPAPLDPIFLHLQLSYLSMQSTSCYPLNMKVPPDKYRQSFMRKLTCGLDNTYCISRDFSNNWFGLFCWEMRVYLCIQHCALYKDFSFLLLLLNTCSKLKWPAKLGLSEKFSKRRHILSQHSI